MGFGMIYLGPWLVFLGCLVFVVTVGVCAYWYETME